MTFEYKVVPAPTRGRKARGAKSPADRFARALEEVMNDLAGEGWEYLRTDTLPSEQRQGLTGRTVVYQNMLVFRRATSAAATAPALKAIPAPSPSEATPAAPAKPARVAAAADSDSAAPATKKEAPAKAKAAVKSSLDKMIASELAAARGPRQPAAPQKASQNAAPTAPPTAPQTAPKADRDTAAPAKGPTKPLKASRTDSGKDDVAAE